jgi:nucleoside-diphosphate-sugar epimerase
MGFLHGKHDSEVVRDNQLINLNMLQASATNKVKRYFFSSSACVYPEHLQMEADIVALKESDAIPANPDLIYGWEKLITEKECEVYKKDHGLETRVARFHNIYGPGCVHSLERDKAPAALCKKVIAAKDDTSIEIWGDGKQTRSFLYIDDCVSGIIRLTESDCDRPLNIGSDRMIAIDDLADIIIAISGKKLSKTHNTSMPQGVRGRNSDNALSKKILGWEPKITLEEGLKHTYEYLSRITIQNK